MFIGADGKGQHSLIASDAAVTTIRLLKTSALKSGTRDHLFDLQSSSSALGSKRHHRRRFRPWGLQSYSVLRVQEEAAIAYDKEGKMMEWTFDGISANSVLGSGQ